ncbi:MAG: glycosyltransferase family 2 protein, partial [Candidatus Marinimicrobia bacterium]|nr:glycosyltransferase family 2 protein [Candidatus Neomarinimicrobiota bacterium]
MTDFQPIVSIIIPHWNGIDVLSECIESLKKSTLPSFEIIVSDNASSDGSQAWIKENHPDIILLENDKNYGYAGGCNYGSNIAKGEFLLFLNNDTIQDPNWLQPLVDQMKSDESIAAIQPKILNYYNRKIFDYAGGSGGHLDLFCFPFARGRVFLEQEKDSGQYDDAQKCFWASGTAMLVRKKTFFAAGKFDETFFAHMEEIDLCWRFQAMGFQVWSEPKSVIYHKNAVSLPMHTH